MKNCTCANGHTYSFPDGCNCYKCCANIGAGRIASVRGGGGNTNLNPASRKSFGFGTSYDGRVRGGIKTPDYTRVPTKRKSFNIFDREHETATNNFDSNAPNSVGSIRKNTGVNAQISRNMNVKDGQINIGNRFFKTLPDGSVIRGRWTNPNVTEWEVGKKKCRGRCKYKVTRPGARNNDTFRGSCEPVGAGCKCGQIVC